MAMTGCVGKMRERLTLQKRVVTVDTFGERAEQWVDVGDLWAERRDLSGRQWFAARESQSEVNVEFEIRSRVDMNSIDCRLRDGLVIYEIHHVIELFTRRGRMVLMCSTRTT